MQLSKDAIERFVEIYERTFNEPISLDDATAMARRLINLYRLFQRSLPTPSDTRTVPKRR